MYKGFNAFVENRYVTDGNRIWRGPCQNCHMNWTKRPRQWKGPPLYMSQPSKEFNCDITDQSRHSQAGPGWKVNARFRGQVKGWKLSQLSQITNQTKNSQQSQMNELHVLSSVITFLKKKNCFAILVTEELWQVVPTCPPKSTVWQDSVLLLTWVIQSSPTSTSGKSTMQTQKGFLWILPLVLWILL